MPAESSSPPLGASGKRVTILPFLKERASGNTAYPHLFFLLYSGSKLLPSEFQSFEKFLPLDSQLKTFLSKDT